MSETTVPVKWEDVPPLVQSAFEGWLRAWGRAEMYLVCTPKEAGNSMYHGTIVEAVDADSNMAYGLDGWMEGAEVKMSNSDTVLADTDSIFQTNLININHSPRQMPFINGG